MKIYFFVSLFLLSIFSCSQDPNGNILSVPVTPTNLSAVLVSGSQIDLSWTDNSTNESGFKIDRKIGSSQWQNQPIATVGANVITFSDLGLSINTTYTYRVYAYNSSGNSPTYSNEVTITTVSVPLITTNSISNITINSASSGGVVTNDAGSAVTSRGVCWSTTPNPTISLQTKTSNGAGTGAFTSAITGLTAATLYYVRAYATNSIGTGYGGTETFTTQPPAIPTVNTTSISAITISGASSGGSITSDGGGSITSKGVVWSTSPSPTVSLPTKTVDGTGNSPYTSIISGLTASTIYYVRAYATNAAGTGYGAQEIFTTQTLPLPTVTTAAITSITLSGALSGGNVTDQGGAAVTVRGIVWGTSPNPTVSLSTKTTDGAGTGTFTSVISALAPGSYYVRAYATNSGGTGYGSQETFTTISSSFTCGISTVTFNYRGATVTYGTVVGAGGRCWLDRNLGASRVASSSTDDQAYGDLFQWGRGDDGHQLRSSGTTSVLSATDNPGHGNFINAPINPFDWRNGQNNNLWQGLNGTNNTCPIGWRLPTEAELNFERLSWSIQSGVGAFASPLKLPSAGYRNHNEGMLFSVGDVGGYWTCSVFQGRSRAFTFPVSNSCSGCWGTPYRASGYSVRCIKD